MQKRNLGRGGPIVGEVGIGCWQLGGDWGPINEPTALQILQTAVEAGTDFLDTADVYGDGVSESLIGHFLKNCDQPVTVATKFGRAAGVYPDNYSLESMRKSVIGSLDRLGVDALDLLQLHCIPPNVLEQGAVFDWLRELKREGLIKQFGASVESVEEALICLPQEGLLSLQVIFNIFRQRLADELLPQAQQRGVGIIVRLPLASGLLSGKFSASTTFHETDHRTFNRDGQCFNVGETFAGLPFEKGVQLAGMLQRFVPTGDDMNLALMSLRWILDHDGVSAVIPGASSPDQAAANAQAGSIDPLPVSLHEQLRQFYADHVESHIRGPY